tara:strand:- start:5044 stop:5901 length:858 start_codon:yes stop_codon:yes gene_type:complete
MAVAIEDAGFEIRDQIMWIYGSGFPKSLNIGKAIDKAAGVKREVVGSKIGQAGYSLADNPSKRQILRSLDNPIGECQITAPATPEAQQWEGWGTALKPAHEPIVLARKPISEKSIADNVVKHGTGALNIDGCRIEPDDNAKIRFRQVGSNGVADVLTRATTTTLYDPTSGRYPANVIHDGLQEEWARYFYCPKTSTAEREESVTQNGHDRNNTHPTVKPVELMRYLCRLVTPKGGTVLDPFMGSGSTGLAAKTEGMEFIGIEREQEYFDIATDRINKTWVQPDLL